MTAPFEVGDKIVCKDDRDSKRLSEGVIYIVRAPETYGFVSVEDVNGGWFYDRFSLVEKAVKEGVWEEKSDSERINKLELQMDRVIRDTYGASKVVMEVLSLGDKPLRLKPKRRIELAKEVE
jgi:hypothetical protein